MWVVYVILGILCVVLLFDATAIKVYRFSSSECPYCIATQDEWDRFYGSSWFNWYWPIEVKIDNKSLSKKDRALVDNFDVSVVPTIWAVDSNGVRVKYPRGSSEFSKDDLYKWLRSLE